MANYCVTFYLSWNHKIAFMANGAGGVVKLLKVWPKPLYTRKMSDTFPFGITDETPTKNASNDDGANTHGYGEREEVEGGGRNHFTQEK